MERPNSGVAGDTRLTRNFAAFGLQMASAFDLPGATLSQALQAEIAITSGPALLPDNAEQCGPYRRLGNRLELEIPAAGRFLLAGDARLEVAVRPDVDPEVLSAYLIASGLPLVLWQRGGIMLHASGLVATEGGPVVVLAGPSGIGKSTLARAWLDRGARLVGDDSLWLPEPATGAVHGLSGGQYLRDAAGMPKFNALPAARQAGNARIGAMVLLTRGGDATGLRRLDPLAALHGLLRHRHRPRIPALLGAEAQVLADCARLAALAPVFELGLSEGNTDHDAEILADLASGL